MEAPQGAMAVGSTWREYLSVSPAALPAVIRDAISRRRAALGTDANPTERHRLAAIETILLDEVRRRAYDRTLNAPPEVAHQPAQASGSTVRLVIHEGEAHSRLLLFFKFVLVIPAYVVLISGAVEPPPTY